MSSTALSTPTVAPLDLGRFKADRLALPLFALLCAAATLYYHYTVLPDPTPVLWEHEQDQVWPRLSGAQLSRSFEYDSVLYEGMFSGGINWSTIVANYTSMPNIFGISLFAHILMLTDLPMVFINLLILLMAGWFLVKITDKWKVNPILPLAALFLNPSTIYYAQTATKEIPLLCGTVIFAWLLVSFKNLDLLLLALPLVTFISIIRVQTGAYFAGVLLLYLFTQRQSLKLLHVGLFGIFALYPLTSLTGFWDAADMYRAESVHYGIGEFIDFFLRTIPFSGYICIPLRALQNALDPFPSNYVFGDGPHVWNTYFMVNLGNFCYASFVLTGLCYPIFQFLRGKLQFDRAAQAIMILLILAWFTVAIVPYVHGRYLYPTTPLAAAAFLYFKPVMNLEKQWLHLLTWTAVAGLEAVLVLSALLA